MNDYDERYQVRNDEIKRILKYIGHEIDDQLPNGWGFTLLLFDYTKGPGPDQGSLFYISSAVREDIIKLMKEFIQKEEFNH